MVGPQLAKLTNSAGYSYSNRSPKFNSSSGSTVYTGSILSTHSTDSTGSIGSTGPTGSTNIGQIYEGLQPKSRCALVYLTEFDPNPPPQAPTNLPYNIYSLQKKDFYNS